MKKEFKKIELLKERIQKEDIHQRIHFLTILYVQTVATYIEEPSRENVMVTNSQYGDVAQS